MASSSNKDDRTASDSTSDSESTRDIAIAICRCIKGIMKITKLKPNENVALIIDELGKHVEELVGTVEGRRLLCNMKQFASQITNKEKFLAILWRMFHVAGRICSEGSGRIGLFFMGTALLVFLLSTVTGVAEGVLAVWFTLAARTFALRLFSSGSKWMHKGIDEAVPDKNSFLNLLNTIVCGSGQEHEQVSREEIQQLEIRCACATVCSENDWVLL